LLENLETAVSCFFEKSADPCLFSKARRFVWQTAPVRLHKHCLPTCVVWYCQSSLMHPLPPCVPCGSPDQSRRYHTRNKNRPFGRSGAHRFRQGFYPLRLVMKLRIICMCSTVYTPYFRCQAKGKGGSLWTLLG